MDVFSIEAVSLGDISKVTVGQDGQGANPGWFLDKIIIKDTDKDKTFFFPCDRYIVSTSAFVLICVVAH